MHLNIFPGIDDLYKAIHIPDLTKKECVLLVTTGGNSLAAIQDEHQAAKMLYSVNGHLHLDLAHQ